MKGVENANIISKGATDRRLALILQLQKSNRQVLSGQGGYFFVLFLIIALRANGITKSKACNA